MPRQQFDNELSGALFRNDGKTGNQPDYRGQCQIDGEEYPISAWVRESAKGVKYMSLSFTKPEGERGNGGGRRRRDDDYDDRPRERASRGRRDYEDDDEDDLPF